MNFKQLEYLIKLGDTGSFSKAAQELYISKQGLSRNIQSLEEELNTSLYKSTVSGTELTAAGQVIYDYAKKLLREQGQMLQALADISGQQQQNLRLAFAYGFFYCISMDLILSFLVENPGVRYDYQCFTDIEMEKQFLNGNFDLAFCTNKEHWDELEYTFLFRNRRCLAVPRNHSLAQKATIRIEDLRNVRIAVSAPGYFDLPFITNQCRAHGFEALVYPLPEWQMLNQFVEAGHGVALIVENYTGEKVSGPNLLALPFDETVDANYDIHLITHKTNRRAQHVNHFIQHAVTYCEQIRQQNLRHNFYL